MQKLEKLTSKERLDFANWLKALVALDQYKLLLDILDDKIKDNRKKNERCKEENAWDRGHVCGLKDARKMPFELIETCGTDQDTPET